MATDLLRETREEIGRADAKASTLLGAVVIVLGVFAAGALAGTWSPLTLTPASATAWWTGVILAGVGVGFLCACIYPNVGNQLTKNVLGFFGHVYLYSTRDEPIAALREHGEQPLARLGDQLFVLSRITRRKYRLMRWAIWCLASSVSLVAIALVVNHVRWV